MAAGHVTGFMREHADDFVGRFRVEQRAGIDEDVAAVHYEGVERTVVEDDHAHVLFGQVGGLENRLRVVAHQLLDLGIADDRHAAGRGILGARWLRRRHDAGPGDRKCRRQRQCPGCWRAVPRPDSSAVFDHVGM